MKGLFSDLMKKLFSDKVLSLDWQNLNDYKDKLQLVRKDTDKKKNVHYAKLNPPVIEDNFNKKFLAPQKSLQVERITKPLSPSHHNNKSLDRIDSTLSKNQDYITDEEVKKMPEELNVIEEKNSSSNSIYINDDCDKNEKKEINEFEDKFLVKKNINTNESEEISTNTHNNKEKKFTFTSYKIVTRSTSHEFEKHSEDISESILNEYQDCNETMSELIKSLKINKLNFLKEM